MQSNFWYDALKYGALLGLIMGLSRIFETYDLFLSDRVGVGGLFVVEWLASVVIFIWLLYRFTKRRALLAPDDEGFSYGSGLSYALMVSMLAGVVVGVMYHIFVSIVGYEAYVEGYISLIDEYYAIIANSGVQLPSDYMEMFEDMKDMLRRSEAPSMFDNLLASLKTYMFTGLVVGLIIAAITRRQPQYPQSNNTINQ